MAYSVRRAGELGQCQPRAAKQSPAILPRADLDHDVSILIAAGGVLRDDSAVGRRAGRSR